MLSRRAAVGLLLCPVLRGQARPEFEVASIKENKLNDRIVDISVGPGPRFLARGYTLVLLIQRAYGVMDNNVTGGPAWIREDRFDIAAKADIPGNLSEEELKPRLANLLAERFKLALHRSSKQESGEALQVARGGHKLTPSTLKESGRDTFRLTNAGMKGQGISMHDFARFSGGKLGLLIQDQTSLDGLWDFDISWEIDVSRPYVGVNPDPREPLRDAATRAIQSKLGLRLVPARITTELLVIDSVEKPSLD